LNDQHKYWLSFSLIPGIGPRRIIQLRDYFGDLAAAWKATDNELRQAGFEGSTLEKVLHHRRRLQPDAELERVQRAGAWLLTIDDAGYPTLLRALDSPPAVLYVRGSLTPTDDRALGVVGTRKATRYGMQATHHLCKQLARHNITIVSGLAHGIDSAAHQGVLEGGGRTLAILGCGIDVIYPRNQRELAQQICDDGALISEFPIGTQPVGANFPRRNRIISGLSLGVLVAEAPENSGALITAGLAAEQGREVFALPGSIFSPVSRGANRLIQDGAKLVMEIEDILDEFNIAHDNAQTRVRTEHLAPSSEAERRLLEHLDAEPIHIDELARLCSLPIAEVTSTLTILELKGIAQMVGHMQYSLVYSP
jgi:DNA processing protein